MSLMVRSVSCAALLVLTAMGLLGDQDPPGEQAKALARQASRAAKARHNAQAYILYSEAAAMQPKNKRYRGRMESLQSRAALEAKSAPSGPPVSAADDDSAKRAEVAPEPPAEDAFDSITARELASARVLRSPATLDAAAGTKDFDLNGPARRLFDQVAESFGLQTVYDGDYPPTGTAVRLRVTGADYREALHDLEAATNSFVVPLSSKLIMVAQDTPQKRTDLEQTMAISIPVPQALTTQELTEIAQAVRQATNIEKLAWNSADGEIVIRDRISRVLPAAALLRQLVGYRPQVMLELEYLEVTDSDLLNYGFTVTNNIPAVFLGHILNNVVSYPSGVTNLITFGGGKTLIGLGAASVQALFNQSISAGKQGFRTQIVASDGQAATFHSGDKYPVVTSTFTGSTATGTGTGTSALQTAPAYTFEDLGVVVKATPRIHGDGQVSLGIETDFEVLTGQSVNSIPIIGRRQITAQVRVLDGEWTVIAGMTGTTDSKSANGFLGLAEIPLLGNLFKQTSVDKENSQILIGIRPVLLSLPPDQMVTPALRVGTETRPLTPL
jgi:type II secretory pathway component GspD/PulD (secretin)